MNPLRLRVLSDIHFEFHRDKGKEVVRGLNPRDVDVLILAGDITRMDVGIEESLALFRKHFACPIIFVPGNHEFHDSNRETVLRAIRAAVAKLRGVHFLDCDIVEIGGRRFLGSTLWYGRKPSPKWSIATDEEWARGVTRIQHPDTGQMIHHQFVDFEAIENLDTWVYDECGRAIRFFVDNLREGDIAISHILPSEKSVPPRFKDAYSSNAFFVTEMGAFIAKSKAALWVHGHAHTSSDYKLGDTRVVCNPFGYQSKGEMNVDFDENFTVEV
jgi:predicted phosphodiesterase